MSDSKFSRGIHILNPSVILKMKHVTKTYDISVKEFLANKLYEYSDNELDSECKYLIKVKKYKIRSFQNIQLETKQSLDEIEETYNRISKTYTIDLDTYLKYKLYLVKKENLDDTIHSIKEELKRIELETKIEKRALINRKQFIKKPIVLPNNYRKPLGPMRHKEKAKEREYFGSMQMPSGYQNQPDDKHPDGIIAACALLGIPLPKNAVCKYQPSAYVQNIIGNFDTVVKLVGEDLIPDTKETRRQFRIFRSKFKSQQGIHHNGTDLAIFFVDWFLFCRDYGNHHHDYFEYEFYNKEFAVRNTFMSDGYRSWVRDVCNNDMELLKDKALFNTFFKDLITRDWLDVSKATKDEFKAFITRQPVFFSKPLEGTGGHGAGIIHSEEYSFDELYAMCKMCIVEELVKQHPEMEKFNPDSCNTIRIYSLVDENDVPRITGVVPRFGIKGMHVDNFHSGGMCTIADVETGKILCKCRNIRAELYSHHPDSGYAFIDFQLPLWDKVQEFVKKGAYMCKDLNRHIGWDIAIEKDKVTVIEGNSKPNFDVLQMDMKGKLYVYKEHMDALAKKLGKKPYPYPAVVLDISEAQL